MKYCLSVVWSLALVVMTGSLHAQLRGVQEVPYEIAPMEAPFEVRQLQRPEFPNREFNILDFGAQEAGPQRHVKSTEAINAAVLEAHRSGGGKVIVPAGEWLTGPIHLLSHVNLHFAEGCKVFFSEDKEDYLPVVIQRYEGVEAYNYSPLIYAYRVKNAAITGKGVLDGQARHWLDWGTVQPRAMATRMPLSRRTNFGKGSGSEGMRPNFMVFWESEDVLVEDVTLRNGPMWNIHLVYTTGAIVRGVTVNSVDSHNGDGIVVDSSSDILLEYNHLETGDDAIVLKSGFNEEGLEINRPTENVLIRNFSAYDVRTGSGGVVFGSETSGGIRNVYVHDAHFERCDRGIRFKTARGRGNATENIYVRDITLKDITYEALNFNTFYQGSGVGAAPLVRNIDIRNIKIDGVPKAIVLIGLPEKWLEDIYLENIEVVNAEEGIRLERVKNLHMNNVAVSSKERAMVMDDVFELYAGGLKLKDKSNAKPILVKGRYSGVLVMGDFPLKDIELEEGLRSDILMDRAPDAEW